MTRQESATLYLSTVCRMNAFNRSIGEIVQSGDLASIRKAGAEGRELAASAARVLDPTNANWPVELDDDVAAVARSYYALPSFFDELSRAQTLGDVLWTRYPDQELSAAAAQRIRTLLELGNDPVASCANR